MKNINKYMLVISVFIFVLISSGCINNSSDTNNLNPFGEIDDNNTMIASEYGHSPCNAPEDVTYYYQGNVLNIPYTFYGGRVNSEVGLLVFIDGIVQQYTIDDSEHEKYDYMKTFNIPINSEETYILNIIPNSGKSGDILKLNFVCIDFPNLSKLETPSVELQNASATISWKLLYLEDAYILPSLSQKEFRGKTISNAIENYPVDGGKEEFNSGLEESNITSEDANKTLTFIANEGENTGHYKTTIFVDNKPTIIDNNSFIEYKVNKDERLIYEIEIDHNSSDDASIFYAISIRLDDKIDDWQSQVDVFKTNSILINTY